MDGSQTLTLAANENLISVSNGLAFIENSETGKTRSAFVLGSVERRNQKLTGFGPDAQVAQAPELRVPQEQVLEMTIDPDQVSVENLEKYRNLMKGNVAKAVSNANY